MNARKAYVDSYAFTGKYIKREGNPAYANAKKDSE